MYVHHFWRIHNSRQFFFKTNFKDKIQINCFEWFLKINMSFDGAVDFYVNKIQIYSKIKLLIKMVIGQARLLFYPCE